MLKECDYCDYDTCVALREIGCRIKTEWYIHQPSYERGACYLCFGIPQETSVLDEYDYIPRLSLYEAQKWLRENEDVIIVVCPYTYDIINKTHTWTCVIWFGDNLEYEINDFKSYEEALSKGIKEAIKILKDGIGE